MKTYFYKYLVNVVLWLGLPLLLAVSAKVFAEIKPAEFEKNWKFKVFLDEREIGTHQVKVLSYQNLKQVSVEADFKVKFLMFTAFNYQHRAEEVWLGNCLSNIKTTTDNNGEALFINDIDSHDGLTIKTHAGVNKLSGCIRSFAYWNRELLKADKLLNTQTGEYEPVRIVDLGKNKLKLQDRQVDAFQYRLWVDNRAVDLWYGKDDNWLALKSKTDDGYQISYYPDDEVIL